MILFIYKSDNVRKYCKTIFPNDFEELLSNIIIQLYKMNENKLKEAFDKGYIEYLSMKIAKRIISGRIKNTGYFYQPKNDLTLEEGYGLDIEDEKEFNYLDLLEEIDKIIKNTHWYDKAIFKYFHVDNLKFKEISKMTGISISSINYSLRKTRKMFDLCDPF